MLAHSFCSGMFGERWKQRSPRYTVNSGQPKFRVDYEEQRKGFTKAKE